MGPGDKAAPTGFAGAADCPENYSVKGGRLFAHFRKSPTGSPIRAPRAASTPHPPANLTLAGRGVGGRPRPQDNQGTLVADFALALPASSSRLPPGT